MKNSYLSMVLFSLLLITKSYDPQKADLIFDGNVKQTISFRKSLSNSIKTYSYHCDFIKLRLIFYKSVVAAYYREISQKYKLFQHLLKGFYYTLNGYIPLQIKLF